MANDLPSFLHRALARCDCGVEFTASTLRAPQPGEILARKCDRCIEAAYQKHRIPARFRKSTDQGDDDLGPPRKVFGYDD